MARRQSQAHRAAADASRRGEQRRLLVELELDDAVLAASLGRQDSRARLSSPYKLKQTVLSSRSSTDDAHRTASRQRRAPGDRRASPSALVRDAIRQNVLLRDQTLAQLRSELLPPAITVPRGRSVELSVPASLIRQLNRLRSLSLAVVETTVYLYSQRSTGGRRGSRADEEEEADAEALEGEFLPYLLRMAASDVDFLAFSPALQRFFDLQGVSLSRNPLVDGLALDASELLLCSCNCVSALSPTALFRSSSVLAASPSSSSLFQLLIHKLEAFALQTERSLPGWQTLPSDRVAIALLHLMELETRSNATKLLPAYLRPSVPRESSMLMASRSTASIRPQNALNGFRVDGSPRMSRTGSSDELQSQEPVIATTPGQNYGATAYQAWGASPSDSRPALSLAGIPAPSDRNDPERCDSRASLASGSLVAPVSPVVEATASTTPGSSRAGSSARSMPEAKQPTYRNTSARLFKKSSGGQKAEGSSPQLPATQQQDATYLMSSDKRSARDSPATAEAVDSQRQAEDSSISEYVDSDPASSLKKEAIGTTQMDIYELIPASPVMFNRMATSATTQTTARAQVTDTARCRQAINSAREERKTPLIPRLSLHKIPVSSGDTQRESSPVDSVGSARRSSAKALPPSPSVESDRDGYVSSLQASTRSSEAEIWSRSLSVSTEAVASSTRPSSNADSGYGVNGSFSGSSSSAFESSTTQLSLTSQPSTERSLITSSSQPTSPNNTFACTSGFDEVANVVPPSCRSQPAGQEAVEPLTMASQIAKAMDLLPRFDSGGSLSPASHDDRHGGSARPLSSAVNYRSAGDDDESVAFKRKIELQPLQGAVACGSIDISQLMSTRSEPVHCTKPDAFFSSGSRAANCDDEAEETGVGALDRVFDLCRKVQVAAFDMGHRLYESEVDRGCQLPTTVFPSSQPARSLPVQVVDKDDAPRYLERELKVLRRYLASWRDNAHHQRLVKRRLRDAAAKRTIQRFGTQCVANRRLDEERKKLEDQHAAAVAVQKSWAGHAYQKEVGRRSNGFHLMHRCFHRLRFFVGVSKRKRQRELAKEIILRWWRRRRDRFRRAKKRQEKLRKQRERREQASRIVRQALREWVLRRRLAKAQTSARQAAFKENLKWTKAKRDHERTLRMEHSRQAQWTSMMKASMAELESKWKQSEGERAAMQLQFDKVVERHRRTVDKKRREAAAHKIQWYMTTCALKRKLQAVETTRIQTDKRLLALNAKTERAEQETQRWRQRMRLEQRLLEKRLAKAEKQMRRASATHESEMQARLSTEKQLQREIARRAIKSFVDRKCLERRARLDKLRHLQRHQKLRAEKQETEAMAAEDLSAHDRGAESKRVVLQESLAAVYREAREELVRRDRLLKTKDDHVQQAAEQLQQNQLDASRTRLNLWLAQQVRVSRVKKQADAALAAAMYAMETEKRRQAELVASQSVEVASLKIGAFVASRVGRSRAKREEAASERRQAELYAKELITEQRLRSFVVELVIAIKLQSEGEALRGVSRGLERVQQLSAFLAKRRARLQQLHRTGRARVVQRFWRWWSARQQRAREERLQTQQRVEAVRRRECARRIQNEWHHWRQREAKRAAEREEREQKLQRTLTVKRRESARHIQRSWRRFTDRRRLQLEERGRRLKRLEVVKRRECARHIQTAWRRYVDRKRRRGREREQKRVRVEAVRRRESARRIQRAWLASVGRKRRAREQRELQIRVVRLVQRRESAKRIQRQWRQHVQRRRADREAIKRVKERVRLNRRRESARRIQRAWRRAKRRWLEQEMQQREQRRLQQQQREELEILQQQREELERQQEQQNELKRQQHQREELERLQQEREELELKQQRTLAAKMRESSRRIGVAWRTAKLRRMQLQLEQQDLEKRLRRVAAVKERECARHIQGGWRRHSGQRRARGAVMDRNVLQADAVRRRECARHIQSGWRHSQERQHELEQAEEELRQRMDRRLSDLRARQCARVVQRSWREWREVQEATRMSDQCLSLLRTRRAARCIQSNWRSWRRAREEEAGRGARLLSVRLRRCARTIQRSWRRWHEAQERRRWVLQQAALLQQRCAVRTIQRAWRGWRRSFKERGVVEDAGARTIQRAFAVVVGRKRRDLDRQALVEKQNAAAARIQRIYRQWRRRRRHVVTGSTPSGDEALAQEQVVAVKMRISSRRIARAWRRFRSVNQFAAATHIGAVWRSRCARQAYALALAAKRAQDERLDEIRLSILAVRVQRCYQDWRVRMRRRKRAEMLARESEMIEQAKRQAKVQRVTRRVSAAQTFQHRSRAFSCMDSKPLGDSQEQVTTSEAREGSDAFAMLQKDESDRDEVFARVNVGAAVERWVRRELPYIVTTGVSSVLVVAAAARLIQRFVRCYQRRALLWFVIKRSSLPGASSRGLDSAKDDEFRFFFKHASAWLEWRRTRDTVRSSTSTLRLRFEAPMTRKLLAMLDRQAHSVDEIRHAVTEIATDALPIFASDECARSHETSADRKMPFHDVGELELPHLCALTRSMGKIRSMHRRQQHSASFTATSSTLPAASSTVLPPSASFRPRCSRVQSLSVFEAVESASVEDARFLQALGADLGAVEPKMLRNALHLLTFSTENYRFRLEMLDFLLSEDRIDMNAMDVNGETPSMLFAGHGHLELLSRMAKRGADLLLTSKSGQNALHRACEEDQVEIVAFLHRSGLPVSPAEFHVPDQSGRFPLHIAASKGLTECAKQILAVDDASSSAETPSPRWDHRLQGQRDSQGRTPLHLAVLGRDTAMVSLLLTHGGNYCVNECDNLRRSAVHFAVEASTSTSSDGQPSTATDALAILTMLVEHGASLDIGDERGDTPLHWAAFAGNVALARFLVTRGADASAVNSDWETPGQVAAAYGHFACVKAMATSTRGHNRGATSDEAGRSATDRMLNEAVNNLAYQQASSQSYHIPSAAAASASPVSTRAPGQGYDWEELHQEVQLVEESGRFSSEDESDGEGDDDRRFERRLA